MKRSRGQALMEYALLLALVSVVCIAVLTDLGQGIREVFQAVDTSIRGR